jgi:hypothetical protein
MVEPQPHKPWKIESKATMIIIGWYVVVNNECDGVRLSSTEMQYQSLSSIFCWSASLFCSSCAILLTEL